MGAIAIETHRGVAVMAEDAKARRIIMRLEPLVQPCARVASLLRPTVDVINRQELHVAVTTAGASGFPIAVGHECSGSQALLAPSVLNALHFWILAYKPAASEYFAPLACPLKAVMICRVIAVEVVRSKRQFLTACRTHACWGCGWFHWCNPLNGCVTPIIAGDAWNVNHSASGDTDDGYFSAKAACAVPVGDTATPSGALARKPV
jgi:hypothetical protein